MGCSSWRSDGCTRPLVVGSMAPRRCTPSCCVRVSWWRVAPSHDPTTSAPFDPGPCRLAEARLPPTRFTRSELLSVMSVRSAADECVDEGSRSADGRVGTATLRGGGRLESSQTSEHSSRAAESVKSPAMPVLGRGHGLARSALSATRARPCSPGPLRDRCQRAGATGVSASRWQACRPRPRPP